ncbi:hypothetical protein E3N88_02626 [Mikania micrantha]|uniref:Protein YIP n=1 Tax=Mikania micrantha TaxID=192012 RepID=A0A5N6Q708_9ASTR|nr:hypothetical protein E3N88_02626 [Mikania micrantha]
MMTENYPSINNQNASGSVPPVPEPPGQTFVKLTDSAPQTFPRSASQGKIAGGSGPPRDADDSLIPFKGTFNEKMESSPDLYGPFWICTTLIFVSALIGTSAAYLADNMHHKEWEYDINLLTWSACVLYGYAIFVPITLYIVLKYLSAPLGIVQLFCLYGYSLFIFIPAVCLYIIPVEMFRWVVVGVAGVMSAMFVSLNLRSHVVLAGKRWFWIVSGITCCS